MQSYSELANWDGSLSAPDSRSPSEPPSSSVSNTVNLFRDHVPQMLDPLQSDPNPLPLSLNDQDAHTQSIYDLYHKHPQTNDRHHQVDHTVDAHPHPSSAPHGGSSAAPFGLPPSNTTLFPSNGQGSDDVLSPQEREIMADITLDPDDPAAWSSAAEKGKDASGRGEMRAVDVLQSRSPSVLAASQRYSTIVPAPPIQPPPPPAPPRLLLPRPQPPPAPIAIASTSASVSPSPFAPRAQITKSSSSSPSHLAAKETPDVEPVHADRMAVPGELETHGGNEYVMAHEEERPRDSPRDPSQSPIGGVQSSLTVDPPLDQDRPSHQSPEPPLAATSYPSSSRSSRVPQERSSKTPLFLPSPTESQSSSRPPPPEPPDVISITSSSSSSSPSPPPSRPPRRSTRNKPKDKQGRQLMAYVLVPSLPSGVRKSDYVPLEELDSKRERSDAVKAQVRAGDNSGSTALAAALQDAFANNASGSGHTDTQTARGRRKTVGKRKAVEPVGPMETIEVVDDDEDADEEAEARNQGSATLVHALSAAFAHNSTNPNVAPTETTGSTLYSRKSTRAGVDSMSVSVEIVVPPPAAKRPRGRPRVVKTNPDTDRTPPASHRRNEKRQPETPSRPQKKRRRVSRRGHDADVRGSEDDGDGDIEILDDPPQQEVRRSPRRKPLSKPAGPPGLRPKRRRIISQYRRVPMPSRVHVPSPSPTPTPPPQSPPATPPPPDNNTLSGHPLTILPVPSPTGIVIAPRALTNLPASPDPPDPHSGAGAQPRQNGSLQGFHGEEAATSAHGLLETPAAAATPMDSGLCAIPTTTAITSTNTDLHHHPPLDIGLDIVVPMDIEDVEQQERQDAVRTAGVPSHALRISNSTHPDGPMLGFALSEHDDGPGPASLSADADTEASSDGFGFGLGMDVIPASVNPYVGDGAGWIGWGAAGPSTDVVTGDGDEYVGDGTIDPSVLGGCAGFGASPGAGSPRKLFMAPAAIDVRKEKLCGGAEADVMDRDFVPLANGARTVVGAGRIGAGDVRIRRKSWRKALADENEGLEDTDEGVWSRRKSRPKALADENEDSENTDGAADDDHVEQCLDAGVTRRSTPSNLSPSEASFSALASASASVRLRVLMGEATFCHHCRRKTKRPKMRCTLIRESTGAQCRKLYCDLCIEKRYPELMFDEFATSFSCPCCCDFCNCTACSRARGEAYIPERNGGWRRWGRCPAAPASAMTADNSSSPPQSQCWQGTLPRDVVRNSEPEPRAASATLEVTSTLASGTQNTLTDEQPGDKATARTVPPVQLSTPLEGTPSLPVSQHKGRRRYVYIGKRLKSWGRLVSIPDPEDQQQQQPPRKKGKRQRKRKRAAGRIRMFAGSEEPLLLSGRKRKQRATKNGRRRRLDGASSPPATATVSLALPTSSSPVRGGGGETDADSNRASEDCNADEGVWPGEYACIVPLAIGKSKMLLDEKAALRMTPEEVQRAIGAAFAVGGQS